MPDIQVKQDDREPSVFATLQAGGVVIDLTGSTVKFIMRNRATGTVKVNASATVLSPTAGTVRYDWGATDTDTIGDYDAEFEITTGAGKKFTCPNGKHLDAKVYEDIA